MDITVIYLTLNRMPSNWVKFHMEHLVRATEGLPVISVSREPISFGNNIIDTDKTSYANIYRQILRASKIANTKYVAVAEDDTLYHADHFNSFRPKDDEFAYNRSRWSVFSWDGEMYSLRQRISNCTLVAPRELVIEALTERFDKFENNPPEHLMGECGRNRLERKMGLKLRKQVDFFTTTPVVQLSHPSGTEERQQIRRKRHGEIRAYDIPYWGKAKDIVSIYNLGGD